MNSTDQIVIVNPAAETERVSMSMAPRLSSLEGARIGIIDNTKHMALPLLKAVESLLVANFGVASFDYYRKENPSVAMPENQIAAMALRCDAVVHGVAD